MTSNARVVIDLDVTGPVISRHLYGHFAEHLGRCIYGGFYVGEDSPIPNHRGIRTDVVDALRRIDIPNLRWPGGCFADDYHWRDGVGPKQDRPVKVNSQWGNVEESNHFGTHEFMELCELLGADPYVNGNVGSGTVREMSEWVEYLTREGDSPMVRLRKSNGRDEPWRVPYWGIGNEPWGCGGGMRAEAYADLARQYATFCRNHGDNELYRIAAGASDDDLQWTETLMRAISGLGCSQTPRKIFHGISIHYYTVIGPRNHRGRAAKFDRDDYYQTMGKAQFVDRIISGHSAIMDAYDPGKTVGLVLDEWGTWWDTEPGDNLGALFQQNTIRDALVASTHFDIFHRHADRLTMANIAQTVNVLQAMILTDDTGALVLTPTYHVFEMNKGHQDATSVVTHLVESPTPRPSGGYEVDLISASASVKGSHALVSLTNTDAERDAAIVLDLRGRTVSGYRGRLLTAPTPQSHNTSAAPDTVVPVGFSAIAEHSRGLKVDLPPHAFATIELELAD